MENSMDKLKSADDILQSLKETGEMNIIEELLKDNKTEFKHNGELYRVRLLNRFEKEEVEEMRCRKFTELLQDKNILLESDLKNQYKNRGIDIDEIDSKVKKLISERENYELKLGEALSKKFGESILKTYKEQIQEIKYKIGASLLQKSNLLSYSLEHRLLIFVTEAVTYFSLEIKKENDWERVFLSFEDFKKSDDEELMKKAHAYSMKLHYLK